MRVEVSRETARGSVGSRRLGNKMNCRPFIGLILTSLLLGGCAMLPRGGWPERMETLPPRKEITSVPFHAQQQYQCGPAALAMALSWTGLAVTPEELTPIVFTPSRQGSLQPDMITATRRYGRIAYVIRGMEALLREVAAGHPVIVLQNLGLSWAPAWHYAVAIGYDVPRDTIILHSGLKARKDTACRVFQNTWSRSGEWGLLVLDPGELPATAEEVKFVESVLGLEKAQRFAEARQGYQTALARWPLNFAAMMGLGNSDYALGDLQGAEAAFRRAAETHPDNGSGLNNLAHVLNALGRRAEARAAARKAVALGGPLKEVFEKTLEEIEAPPP